MMNNAYHKEEYSFRFIGLNEKDIIMLKNSFTTTKLRVGQLKDPIESIVTIEIKDNAIIKKIERIVQQMQLDSSQYGIWISLVTESDSDGLTIPDFITQLHRNIGGKIDFSFTLA